MKPCTILKRPDPVISDLTPMQIEPKNSSNEKGKQQEKPPEVPKPREAVLSSSRNNVNPSDIKVQDPTKKSAFKEKTGPLYKFASELQE